MKTVLTTGIATLLVGSAVFAAAPVGTQPTTAPTPAAAAPANQKQPVAEKLAPVDTQAVSTTEKSESGQCAPGKNCKSHHRAKSAAHHQNMKK